MAKTRQIRSEAHKQADWILRVNYDQFSQQTSCRLYDRSHDAVYAFGAIGFDVPKRTQATDVVIRIDGNDAVQWRNLWPELSVLGVPLAPDAIANSTSGVVWIPRAMVANAILVQVRAKPKKKIRRYSLKGFSALYQQAQNRGCVSETQFIR